MYLHKSKDEEAIKNFFLYITKVENQINIKVKALQSDGEYGALFGEYGVLFGEFHARHKIIYETTTSLLNKKDHLDINYECNVIALYVTLELVNEVILLDN